MSQWYAYRIALAEGGSWHWQVRDEGSTGDDRHAADVARAVLEDWVIDHPGGMPGGGRVIVQDAVDLGEPSRDPARVRVDVFLDPAEEEARTPSASAYLLAADAEDPDTWVNL